MFFAKPGIYEPCGIFSITHIIVLVICLVLIGIFVYKIRNITAKKLNLITRIIAIVIVFLEIGKIVFSFVNHQTNLDSWVPLYFCSMFIFATILSGYAKGWLKSLADAFIGSGGIIAGAMFLIMPSTSLTIYPMFHYLLCYSMLYHSLMVFLGMGYLLNGIVVLNKSLCIKYMIFCSFFSLVAVIFNVTLNTNFMFLREPYNIPLPFLKPLSEKLPIFYTLLMFLSCTGGTYLVIDIIVKLINNIIKKKEKLLDGENNSY